MSECGGMGAGAGRVWAVEMGLDAPREAVDMTLTFRRTAAGKTALHVDVVGPLHAVHLNGRPFLAVPPPSAHPDAVFLPNRPNPVPINAALNQHPPITLNNLANL